MGFIILQVENEIARNASMTDFYSDLSIAVGPKPRHAEIVLRTPSYVDTKKARSALDLGCRRLKGLQPSRFWSSAGTNPYLRAVGGCVEYRG